MHGSCVKDYYRALRDGLTTMCHGYILAPKAMKRKKSIGLRLLLGITAIACGLAVQVLGAFLGKVIAGLEILFAYLGFIVMGYLIYKWAIK